MKDEIRIKELRDYLIGVLKGMIKNKEIKINANMLSKNIDNFSLDKIPTASTVERWITGGGIYKDVFSFRSRKTYSTDEINNLNNIGFFEKFENIIKSNNMKGVLPEINGIQAIECLNTGTMISANTNTAEFDIQLQITYREV
jgi:hypothetical protein